MGNCDKGGLVREKVIPRREGAGKRQRIGGIMIRERHFREASEGEAIKREVRFKVWFITS